MSTTITPEANNSASKGLLFALFGFAVFSWHDALVKLLTQYSVFQIIFFAMLFGAVPFTLVQATSRRGYSMWPRNPALVLARSLTSVLGLCLAFYAFTVLPLVDVYVLLFTAPALISLLAIPFLGERIAAFRWFAIFLGLLGVIVVLRPNVETFSIGHLAGIGSALCIAIGSIISRSIGSKEHAATMIIYPLLTNITLCGIAMSFNYIPMPLEDLALMFAIGTMALIGQFCLLKAYRAAPAAFVAPMQYSQLLWAVLIGAVMFGEYPDNLTVVGALIIVVSGLLIVWRESQVSENQPLLNTRNVRPVMAPPVNSRESDNNQTQQADE